MNYEWIFAYAMSGSYYVLPSCSVSKAASENSPVSVALDGACSDTWKVVEASPRRFIGGVALLTSSLAVNCKARSVDCGQLGHALIRFSYFSLAFPANGIVSSINGKVKWKS